MQVFIYFHGLRNECPCRMRKGTRVGYLLARACCAPLRSGLWRERERALLASLRTPLARETEEWPNVDGFHGGENVELILEAKRIGV